MQIKKRIDLPASPQKVWNALTDPNVTKRYFFGCEVNCDWKIGSPLSYSTEFEGKRMVHVKGTVLAYQPYHYLVLTSIAPAFEGDPKKETKVTYTLTPHENFTKLSIVHGDFHDQKEFEQNNNSWDLVLNGLKAIVSEQ